MGPTGPPFEDDGVRRRRASGYRGGPHPKAVYERQHRTCRSRADGPQPDAGSWADRHKIDRQEVDRSQGHGQEVDGSQVHEARGSREEGRGHEEAEDGARPQGGCSQVHRQKIHGAEVDGSQVHEARDSREEGGGDPEAADDDGTQGTFAQLALLLAAAGAVLTLKR